MTEKRELKLYIETLGCPKNFNDSEAAAGIWLNASDDRFSFSLADSPDDANVFLINTCGFINDAKKESIDTIFDFADITDSRAKSGNSAILVVSGCLSQRYSAELYDEMPEVDIFLGVNEYESLPEIVASFAERRHNGMDRTHTRCRYSSDAPVEFEEFSARYIEEGRYTATLRIAEGCNNRCAYCVIPHIRGGLRSRPMENILKEARELIDGGVKEIILIAQDLTAYGQDIYGELKLPELLRRICAMDDKTGEPSFWIRLMYCYEDKITDELIDVMASEPNICDYIDIPLQHISDNVLSQMRRRSTEKSIKDTIGRLREAIPDIHIRTTFITGFPGETDADFETLLKFAENAEFERLGVFAYSQEEGTPAGEREDQIDEDVRAARADAIMCRQVDISRAINEEKIGSILRVLVEGPDEEKTVDGAGKAYIGRTEYDAPEIDGTVIFTAEGRELKPGDFAYVEITDAFDYDLTGRLAE